MLRAYHHPAIEAPTSSVMSVHPAARQGRFQAARLTTTAPKNEARNGAIVQRVSAASPNSAPVASASRSFRPLVATSTSASASPAPMAVASTMLLMLPISTRKVGLKAVSATAPTRSHSPPGSSGWRRALRCQTASRLTSPHPTLSRRIRWTLSAVPRQGQPSTARGWMKAFWLWPCHDSCPKAGLASGV